MKWVIWQPVFQVNVSGQLPSLALPAAGSSEAAAEREGWWHRLLQGQRGLDMKPQSRAAHLYLLSLTWLTHGTPPAGFSNPIRPGFQELAGALAATRGQRWPGPRQTSPGTQPGWRRPFLAALWRRLSPGSHHPYKTALTQRALTDTPPTPVRHLRRWRLPSRPTRCQGQAPNVLRRRVPAGPKSLSSHPPAGARPQLSPHPPQHSPPSAAAILSDPPHLPPRPAAGGHRPPPRRPAPPRRPRLFPARAHPRAGSPARAQTRSKQAPPLLPLTPFAWPPPRRAARAPAAAAVAQWRYIRALGQDECSFPRWRRREEGRRWTRLRPSSPPGRGCTSCWATRSTAGLTGCPSTRRAPTRSAFPSSTSTTRAATGTGSASMWAGSSTSTSTRGSARYRGSAAGLGGEWRGLRAARPPAEGPPAAGGVWEPRRGGLRRGRGAEAAPPGRLSFGPPPAALGLAASRLRPGRGWDFSRSPD